MMVIRYETDEDHAQVRHVNESAFGRRDEAALVDALREAARPYISLVAVIEEQIVGHIFFSPVSIEPHNPTVTAMGLAPMAVLPEYQGQRIGSALVREGLKECERNGCDIVVVVGHASYYPKFGFTPAKAKGLRCEYDVPDDVFMVIELKPGATTGIEGLVRYRPEFNSV